MNLLWLASTVNLDLGGGPGPPGAPSAYNQRRFCVFVPDTALGAGFLNRPVGTHAARTMMLGDLRRLLEAVPRDAAAPDYRAAATEENALLKNTANARRETFLWLRQLYALDPEVLLFRALRDLWDADAEGQPLLALLSASARDALLRSTAPVVLGALPGVPVNTQEIARAADEHFPGQYSAGTLALVGRQASSTWQQAGLLKGRVKKVRVRARATPAVTAYALLLGHLCDVRGEGLFRTLWAQLLDATPHELMDQAVIAARHGWLEYRRSGTITDISFQHLLRGYDEMGGLVA